ncbi:MAG: competence type IV pilus ATPase ComGA [Bacillus sp. (in: firmicutes)]
MKSIETMAEQLLQTAIQLGASDIHIVPRKSPPHVQFRIENRLIPYHMIAHEHTERMISHFKFLSGMDIGEKRRPQNGSMSITSDNRIIGLRLSSLPTAASETLVIRILPNDHILPLEQLLLFPSTARKILSLMQHSHGLLILSGPTGCGKTTTLYSLLHYAKELNDRNIITLEDPIENISDDVLQVQINEKAGISYSVGLKAALRHDPDVIMVGEIRDSETAKIAIRAALTGHLILTTMHTRDAEGAIHRLREFGVTMTEIRQTLIAVSAQRLLELTCPICGTVCSPYCHFSKRKKRAGVFELLYGKALCQILVDDGGKGVEDEQTSRELKDEIRKAVALGFVREEEYGRWVYEES